MTDELPAVPQLETISKRLPEIFPDGTANRTYVIRDMSGKAIFVMFYVGAIEGRDQWLRPDQVTKMNDAQAGKTDLKKRLAWRKDSIAPGKMKDVRNRWYAGNTRESIRDESLQNGLVLTGAVVVRPGVPTTSSKPRYALAEDFAALFSESLTGKRLEAAIQKWRADHLNPAALARIQVLQRSSSAEKHKGKVLVKFPNGESRLMSPGPSSFLTKEVIENFAPKFLRQPAVVFLSESGNKIVAQDQDLAKSIGLTITADKNLPDVVLADTNNEKFILVFVEVVHSDGPITEARKKAFLQMAEGHGYQIKHIVFLTVFSDRSAPAFRKLCSSLAWGSFVWFAAEPDQIMILKDKEEMTGQTLADLFTRPATFYVTQK